MRIKSVIGLGLVTVLSMISMASAHIIATVGPGEDVGDGLTAYTIYLNSDNGLPVTAFEGGFTGAMHQVKAFDSVPIPHLEHPTAAYDANYSSKQDSLFLFSAAQMTVETPLEETDTTLTGTFGIKPATKGGFTTTHLALAQIVLAPGSKATIYGMASDARGNKSQVYIFPEPTTSSFLVIALIGLLRRRI